MNLISDQGPFPVLLIFLRFPCHVFSSEGVGGKVVWPRLVATVYSTKPHTDEGLLAILDMTC